MKGNRVLLLGLGMQGRAALHDLNRSDLVSQITVVDNSPDIEAGLAGYSKDRVRGLRVDVTNEDEIVRLMREADVVVELLPGPFAFPMAMLAVRAGVSLVSAMYFANPGETDPEKIRGRREALRGLEQEARTKGVTIIQELGMDPGIDLAISAKVVSEFDEVTEFTSYGAGFPDLQAANNPLKYKFTWSLIGLLRSYFRPARVMRQGRIIDIPPDEMFSPENTHILDIPELGGPLECFANGDSLKYAELFGIRDTVTSMGRYICRWPGHGSYWWTMAKCGFLSEDPISVGDARVKPIEFLAALLGGQEQFYYSRDERDIALIRADVTGLKGGKQTRVVYQLIDRRDLATGLTAMSRTTGFAAAIGAQMILNGDIGQTGFVTPMQVPFEPFSRELARRGLNIVRIEYGGETG